MSPSLELVADSVADLVEPNEPCDTEGDPSNQEEHETVMHGFLTVVAAGYLVEGIRRLCHDHYVVDPQGDDTQQDEFEQGPVGLDLPDRSLYRWRDGIVGSLLGVWLAFHCSLSV